MNDFIPFHCLVFCDDTQLVQFPQHERLSYRTVAHDLVGDDGDGFAEIIIGEICHRVALKLSLGQRVAVSFDQVALRQRLTTLATAQGASVLTLGDGCSLVPRKPDLAKHWKGITVIGDVHGDLRALHTALQWAQAREHFVWFLGDVIDYGAETLETANAVYHAVMSGMAGLILGNHERKIARWLDQCETGKPHIRLNEGNRVTTNALNKLKAPVRNQWIGRFRGMLAHASLLRQIDNVTMLHAAAHPTLWSATPNSAMIEQYALYGESDHSGGKYRRIYRWIDAVPTKQIVLVGHDSMGQFPTIITGQQGGQVIFLDTGCGAGGYLSSADLRFDDNGLRLECFNRH